MTDPKMPEPVAYLYHDADKPENAHPLFHSTMLVMPFGRREGGRNETPLITTTAAQAYAEAMAAARVAQERERWATAARLCVQATPEQLPMALDALADVLSAQPPETGKDA